MNLKERLARIGDEVIMAEVEDKKRAAQKKKEIEEAERLKDEPVSESKLVGETCV